MKTSLERVMRPDERGASTMEYVIMIVILALAVGAAVVTYRNKVAEKVGQTGSSVERMKVEALSGDSVSSRSGSGFASAPWRPTGGDTIGRSGGLFTKRAAGYALLAVLAVIVVGVALMRRRSVLADEAEEDETPPAGVISIGGDEPPPEAPTG